jgi:hypothetical protein
MSIFTDRAQPWSLLGISALNGTPVRMRLSTLRMKTGVSMGRITMAKFSRLGKAMISRYP